MVTVRKAEQQDVPEITAIYNEAVHKTVATFDTEPRTLEKQRAWFDKHGERLPVLVAEQDGAVIGWASLSEWSDRIAYQNTVELSFYVSEQQRGQGIGRMLLAQVLEEGRQAGLHTVLARITEGNETSLHLHRQFGFETVGVMKEVGYKFGRLLDVHLLQKML